MMRQTQLAVGCLGRVVRLPRNDVLAPRSFSATRLTEMNFHVEAELKRCLRRILFGIKSPCLNAMQGYT